MLIAMYRQTPPWRKMDMVAQMNETVRVLVMSGLRITPSRCE